MEIQKISPESIQKALETLGLSKPAVQVETEADKLAKLELKKAEEQKELIKAQYETLLKQAEELKAKIDGKVAEPAAAAAPIVKSETSETIGTGLDTNTIFKSLEDKIGALALLVASKSESDSKLDDLQKGLNAQALFNEQLATKIGMIERQPLDRKSVSGVKAIERFEKSENPEKIEPGFRTLDLNDKGQRKQLADILYTAALDKDGKLSDQEFAKAVTPAELGSLGTVQAETDNLARRLKSEHKIIVINSKNK